MYLNIEQNNLHFSTFNNTNPTIETKSDLDTTQVVDNVEGSTINSAVNLSISNDNVQNFLNEKSAQFAKGNTNAQQVLSQIANGNKEYSGFFEGEKFEKTFSLESVSYEGKEFSKLQKEEAKELLTKDSFFASEETAKRIEAYVEKITGNDKDALEEVKEGLKRGYEEAMKLFNEKELPAVSQETEKKVFDVIERKIEQMLKTDLEKKVDAKFLEKSNI